jgi:hypothetical protein
MFEGNMKFKLEESNRGLTDEELLEDMRRAAEATGRKTITMVEYEKFGKLHSCTIQRRFGSWVKAQDRASLQPSRSKIGITDKELFKEGKENAFNA